jgi:hypothetical protein
MFFREAISQGVVKVGLVDLQYPRFYLGKPYHFARRFYGPKGAKAGRSSKNEKLDRFYYYYLNSPELPFSKTVSEQEHIAQLDSIPKSRPLVLDSEKVQVYDTKLGQVSDSAAYLYLTDGRTIQTSKIYFESNGCYYFGEGVKRDIYKIAARWTFHLCNDSRHQACTDHAALQKSSAFCYASSLIKHFEIQMVILVT